MNTLYKCAVVVLILGVAATTGRGAITISVVDSGDLDPGTIYNLTELGMTDWVLYTDADLTPDEQKNGGTAIGALTLDVGGVTAVNSGYNPRFSWSDGDPSGTVSTANADPDFLLTSDEAVATLSLEVAADNRPSTLYMFVGVNRVSGTLTATLSDDAGSPVSAPEFSVGDSFAHVVYKIDYIADSPGETLAVDWSVTTQFGSSSNARYLRYQGAALTTIPEPASLTMVVLAGAALLRRRRRA